MAGWILHLGAFVSVGEPIEQIQAITKVIGVCTGLQIRDPLSPLRKCALNTAGSKAGWILHLAAFVNLCKPIEQVQAINKVI